MPLKSQPTSHATAFAGQGLRALLVPFLCLVASACQNPLGGLIDAKVAEVADTNLTSITVSLAAASSFRPVSLVPSFDPAITSYTLSGDALVSKGGLSALLGDSGASLEYQVGSGSWKTIGSGVGSEAFDLSAGTTRLSLRVTSENGIRMKVYTIDAIVPAVGAGRPAVLLAPSPAQDALFGDTAAMSDNGLVLAVSDVSGNGVHVYSRVTTASAWALLSTLPASGASSSFGSALAISGDGHIVAVGSRQTDKKAWLFDVATGGLLATLDAGAALGTFGFSLALSGDGSVLAVGHDRYYDNAKGTVPYWTGLRLQER